MGSLDAEIVKWIAKDGIIAPVIDRCFPLVETVEAIRYVINTHAQGKIIIKVVQSLGVM